MTDTKSHQKTLKVKYLAEDLRAMGKDADWVAALRTTDFTIRRANCLADLHAAREFVRRYEWLGDKLPRDYSPVVCLVEHRDGMLAGVTWFSSPNSPSTLCPPGCREFLLSRGSTVSWAPVNLGTWMTTRAIDLLIELVQGPVMVSGYADPRAGERGGIYRASNWMLVSTKAGAAFEWLDPDGKVIPDRKLRAQSTWKRLAKQEGLEIVWRPKNANGHAYTPDWEKTPMETVVRLKAAQQAWRGTLVKIPIPAKQKFCIVRGRTPRETRRLHRALLLLVSGCKRKAPDQNVPKGEPTC